MEVTLNRTVVELSKYLQFVQATLKNLLNLVNSDINFVYFLFDGAFGNNDALQMVRQCELHLISKMRYDSALYLPYVGKYSGRGPLRSYEKKLNCRALPKKYLKSASIDGKIRTCIYQVNVWHKLFADMLNVVIVVKTNLKTGQTAHVIFFSSNLVLCQCSFDGCRSPRFILEKAQTKVWTPTGTRQNKVDRVLGLAYDKLIEYYQLRFQIEFNLGVSPLRFVMPNNFGD